MEELKVSAEEAENLLNQYGSVRKAIDSRK
jgi:hypothetical protein